MKRIVTLLLLLWVAGAAAQALRWTAQPFIHNQLTQIRPAPDGSWVLGGSSGDFPHYASVSALSASGQPLWNIFLNWEEYSGVTGLLALPDGSVVMAGNSDGCDYIVPGYVTCLDKTGQTLWTYRQSANPFPTDPAYSIGAVIASPDSNIFVTCADKIIKLRRTTGELMDTHPLTKFNLPADMYYQADKHLFVIGGHRGITLLSPGNKTETVIDPASPGAEIVKVLPWTNGHILALTNTGVIEEHSGSGAVVHPLDFTVRDMVLYGDSLLLCGRNAEMSVVRIANTAFEVIGGFEIGNPNLMALRMQADANGVFIAGEEHDGPLLPQTPIFELLKMFAGNHHFWAQRYDWKGLSPLPEITDAALTELVVHKPPKAFYKGKFELFPWGVKKGTFSVRLKNTGEEPLYRVNLNSTGYGQIELFGGACFYQNSVFIPLTGLNLAPGADTLIYVGEIGTDNTTSVSPWELCIWTSAPNGVPDRFHGNDYVCGAFDLVSSAAELELPAQALFPNPVQDVLYLNLDGLEPGVCRIFDAAGRLVLEQKPVADQGYFRLETGRLAAGMYFLQSGSGWGRFVKN